jgi:hypothetical protein
MFDFHFGIFPVCEENCHFVYANRHGNESRRCHTDRINNKQSKETKKADNPITPPSESKKWPSEQNETEIQSDPCV